MYNMVTTGHLWLFTLKLIKITVNKKDKFLIGTSDI